MHRLTLAILIGALLLHGSSGAQPAPQTSTTRQPEETGPPKQDVVSGGTLPDGLEGRWLAVGWIPLKETDKAKTTTSMWEVTREDAQLVMREYYHRLPDDIGKAVANANADDKAWKPTPEDLATLKRDWSSLPEYDPKLATVRQELYGKDGFDRDFQNEGQTRDAMWAVRQTGQFRRSAAPVVRSINVYGATQARDGGWTGNYTAATIAAAPFPIPIKLEGTFQLYRVGDAPPPKRRGFLSSLFSGCGRP